MVAQVFPSFGVPFFVELKQFGTSIPISHKRFTHVLFLEEALGPQVDKMYKVKLVPIRGAALSAYLQTLAVK